MSFEFTFASLLKLRRYEERRKQQKLGKLLKTEKDLEGRLLKCRQEVRGFDQELPFPRKQKVSEFRQRCKLKQDLQEKAWKLEQKLSGIQEDIQQQRKQLIAANKKVQMLEKLEGRERAQFIAYHQDVEQKQQNEIATQMYNKTS